jgi:hypothetical protein
MSFLPTLGDWRWPLVGDSPTPGEELVRSIDLCFVKSLFESILCEVCERAGELEFTSN